MRDRSGGEGEFRGGDGVIREYEFLEQIQVSILSEVGVFKEVLEDEVLIGLPASFKTAIWTSRRRTRSGGA